MLKLNVEREGKKYAWVVRMEKGIELARKGGFDSDAEALIDAWSMVSEGEPHGSDG